MNPQRIDGRGNMVKEIRIENYKSIQKLKFDLGRLTVLIGENGSGKSNILEAIALSSAAAGDKLDNEFLVSRGIRVTEPKFMRAAFERENVEAEIKIFLEWSDSAVYRVALQNDNRPYSEWSDKWLTVQPEGGRDIMENLKRYFDLSIFIKELLQPLGLHEFLIYSPENPALRTFEREGQIQPLGINGEGLFKLLKVLSLESPEKLQAIKERLQLIDWFEDFEIPKNLFDGEKQLRIRDRYLALELADFDQKSANEGFLFLLFYFTLFISDETPKFFAVDNIDASLNPKLCSRLVKELAQLATECDKQAILTTHNPAVLDGLNLDDDMQRLFVVYRNKLGHTKVKRILKPEPLAGQEPVKLSEAFLRGYIGGLPKNF
jgi:predicted ATPase